jgi:tRNA A-37 threonylcarbamoyl transferase component Bud32
VTARVAWHAGDPAIRRSVEDALHGEAADRREILRDNLRRRVFAWCADGGPRLLVKHFKTLSGRHAFRERLKAAVGRSGATREWNALRALRAAGVSVPEPLALGTLPQGDPVLVTRYVEGPLLRHAEPGITSRRQVWETLGSQIRALHRAGFVHNDLHADNVILTKEGPVLVDLQHVRRTRSRRARCNDLGQLDFGLLGIASTPQRTRVAAAALGLVRPFGKDARRWLRAVRRASLRRADAHARSRTRRSLRVGRRFARVEIGPLRGMRLRSFDAEATAAVLEAHRDALARSDGRVVKRDARSRITELDAGGTRVVVKQVLPRGPARILADLFRGSPARRAWLAGHGLVARGVGVAEPLAFVDRRILGLPVESLVVLRSLYPARPAEEVALEPRDLTPAGRRARGARDRVAPTPDRPRRPQGQPRLAARTGCGARAGSDRPRGRALSPAPDRSAADPSAGPAQRLAPRRVSRARTLRRVRALRARVAVRKRRARRASGHREAESLAPPPLERRGLRRLGAQLRCKLIH